MHLFLAFMILFSSSTIQGISESSTKELPDCSKAPKPGDSAESKTFRELFIVSTLDGKISALDPRAHGNVVWSHETGPGRLLSSSISKLEMHNRGQRVRLVPSLDGSLYKFNGETVEPLPMSADFLLRSSYRLGDDLVITGGKESRTYGINLHTGQVRYVCTMGGCENTEEDFSTEDVLVVKRNTQTVRAVEPRSGREKWNFSVGENQLTVLKGLLAGCGGSSESGSSSDDAYLGEEPANCSSDEGCPERSLIQVVVPEGLVAATSSQGGSLEWSVKLPSPVVGAWHLRDGELEVVNLFEQSRILGLDGPNQSKDSNPVLYLGMHDRQLYVQHSGSLQPDYFETAVQVVDPHRSRLPRVEWKPYVSSAPSRTPIINTGNKPAPPMLEEASSSRKALMIKDDILDYPFDTGYYLYRGVDLDNDSVLLCEKEEAAETFNEHIVRSLRFWWKEISLIVLATFLMNIFITRHVLRRSKLKQLQELSSKEKRASSGYESGGLAPPEQQQPVGQPSVDVGSTVEDLPKYTSRYLADFEPVRCLGKGGFGLVLESRNKLDDCTYAVKRICLPNNPDARDKVMREAKALAKLDHSGIVRYYNAWLESPPPGWQEHQDDVWQGGFDPCSSFSCTDKTATSVAKHSSWGNATRPFNPLRPFEDQFSFGGKGGDAVFSSVNSSSSGITIDELPSNGCSSQLPFSAYAATEDDDSLIEFVRSGTNGQEEQTETSAAAVTKENGGRPKSLSLSEPPPTKMYLYIQMQLCKKESLKEWLHAHSTDRNYEAVLDIFYQIVSAVEYVHDNGLIHRDLKPSNIFFAMDDAIKVGDFGLVTALTGGSVVATPLEEPSGEDIFSSQSGRLTDQVGTQLYMSPEQIDGLKYNQSVDIFSLGLIFFELLWPFSTQMERIQVLMNAKRLKFPPNFVTTYATECKLIKQLLSHESDKRPSARDIRQHALFRPFQPRDEIAHLARLRRRHLSHRQSSSLSD
ncbi:eukaryotic translation initiation factor 2-alpha kinase 3-like isoform X1 [Haemaphysalis longicornis]